MSVCLSLPEEMYRNRAAISEPVAPVRRGSDLRALRRVRTAASEIQLVRRLKAGDQHALEKIFDLYSTRLYNLAQRILGDAADAEEVIQDVFWTAFQKARSFQGNSQLYTWLYRLTVNAALGRMRRRKAQKQTPYEEYLPKFDKDGDHSARPVVDWSETVEERYARREIHGLVRAALNQLKPFDKAVVMMSDIEGLSDREIAEALDLTVSAVKTRLHRARLFVRGKLAVHLGH